MTKFIYAAMFAVLGITYDAAPAEACGPVQNVAARARVAVRNVVKSTVRPCWPNGRVVPAFAPMPATFPLPMPSVKADADLEARVSRLEKKDADAGRALLFGIEPKATATKTSSVTVAKSSTATTCPGGACPAAAPKATRFLPWRR